MVQALVKLVIVFAVIVALLAAGSFLLPRSVNVTRSAEINAPVEVVFENVNSLQRFSEWSPWSGRDAEMKMVYSGPDAGVGAAMTWESKDRSVGSGTQVITGSTPYEEVTTALDFGPMGSANASFHLSEGQGGTVVEWKFQSDLGNKPVARWMGLMMDGWVGGDYEKGLANLKSQLESGS